MPFKQRVGIAILVLVTAVVIAAATMYFGSSREVYLAEGGTRYLVMLRIPIIATGVIGGDLFGADKPSVRRTGDRMEIVWKIDSEFTSSENTIELIRAENERDWLRNKKRSDVKVPQIDSDWSTDFKDDPPIPYLHRVDDDRVIEYFTLAASADAGNPDAASTQLDIATKILNSHPDDPYVRVLYLAALARNQKVDEMRARLREWGDDPAIARDKALSTAMKTQSIHVQAADLRASGRNGFDIIERIIAPETDLETQKRLVQELLKYDTGFPSIMSGGATKNPHFLSWQVVSKTLRTRAVFMMLEGRHEEAFQTLAGIYRLGQIMVNEPRPPGAIIATLIRTIACDGIENFVLNDCRTTLALESASTVLDELRQLDRQRADDDSTRPATDSPASLSPSFDKPEMRALSADARLQLVRLAAAARHRLLAAQSFPTADTEFAPLLRDGPPNDPFTSTPLRYVSTTDLFVGYSVGPDKIDDGARIAYDVTNGTLSNGDIITSVPRDRRIPFPEMPVHASSGADLDRQFPAGLPPDIFADTKGRGLSRTATAPVRVFSFGPDTDEGTILPQIETYIPEIQYDPTNGIVSHGDLFITLPEPGHQ